MAEKQGEKLPIDGEKVIRRATPKIEGQAIRYVSFAAQMADQPSKLSDQAQGQIQRAGKTFRALRAGARIPIETAAQEIGVNDALLFLFESGLRGGEIISVGTLDRLSHLLTDRGRERGVELMLMQVDPSSTLDNIPVGDAVQFVSKMNRFALIMGRAVKPR